VLAYIQNSKFILMLLGEINSGSFGKKLVAKLNNIVTVYTVNGDKVRDALGKNSKERVDWMLGSHHFADHWIPKKELWIERMLAGKKEEKHNLLHELVELVLMEFKHGSYKHCHEIAKKYEVRYRHGEDVNKIIDEFFKKYAKEDDGKMEELKADIKKLFKEW
jgi:hypothetical protein